MKLMFAWFAVVALALVTAGSCSINHRSADYECASQADCSAGRVCSGGYCVVEGGPIDAAVPPVDGANPLPPDAPTNACPPQCSSCNAATKDCKIDCAVTNCVGNSPIVCPAGWTCDIRCSTPNACRNGVDCRLAEACDITCSGNQSCRGLMCGEGPCQIECADNSTCRGIDCRDSCACDVACSGPLTCEQVACSDLTCGTFEGGCTSGRPGCDTCP